jgi:hypothetical protein
MAFTFGTQEPSPPMAETSEFSSPAYAAGGGRMAHPWATKWGPSDEHLGFAFTLHGQITPMHHA